MGKGSRVLVSARMRKQRPRLRSWPPWRKNVSRRYILLRQLRRNMMDIPLVRYVLKMNYFKKPLTIYDMIQPTTNAATTNAATLEWQA